MRAQVYVGVVGESVREKKKEMMMKDLEGTIYTNLASLPRGGPGKRELGRGASHRSKNAMTFSAGEYSTTPSGRIKLTTLNDPNHLEGTFNNPTE